MNKENIIEFETIKSHKNRLYFLCGFVCVVVLLIIFIVTKSHAKYRVTQSIPLVNGTINYSLPDLNIVGLYIDGVEATELDSSKKYTLDTTQSTCTYKDGSTISDLTISYDSETGELQISPFTTNGTKCTLYFEEKASASDTILANTELKTDIPDFSKTSCASGCGEATNGLYKEDTSKGTTYYFRGTLDNNWVKFADFYWRIIRINEDGSLRIIYQGTEANTTGTGTQIGTSAFNTNSNDNAYVGYMYGTAGSGTYEATHVNTNDSTIKEALDEWYRDNLLSYADKIDGNAGFCNDRTTYRGSGAGTTITDYEAYNRLRGTNKAPTFECENESDLYTTSGSSQGNKALQYPIGLITADEVAFAGGVYGQTNESYYLYTGQNYRTMSPYFISNYGRAGVFGVRSDGYLYNWGVDEAIGVRPVVNLKFNIQFSEGNGTASNPYVI